MNIFLSGTRRVSSPLSVWKCLIAVGLLYAGLDLMVRAGDADLDSNGNGITLDQYEQLFGLDLRNPDVAILDYDQDGVSNLAEAYKGTDPCRADTDEDGWPDGIDNDISRARLDFHPLFTDGNSLRYVWPSWMVSAWKTGGEWENSLPAWTVPAGTGGRLCLKLDRSILTQDLRMELEFYDAPHASLFVDLVNNIGEVLITPEGGQVSSENLMDGSGLVRHSPLGDGGEIVRKSLTVPLESYPEAVGIHLRGTGELFVFGVLLFSDQENDGLDANQEAALGTSDLMSDSDGDGISDYDEVFVYGTNPAKRGASPASIRDKAVSERTAHSTEPPASRGTNPLAFRATRLNAVTIPQWVMARQAGAQSRMSGADFIMPRDTLSGGGTRQTSESFIMEDSFGQSSPIGFSYSSNIILHAGYQQAEEEELLEIRNVSVTPRPYNGVNRRFCPQRGETSTFSYVISTPAETVTVEVWSEQDTNTPVISCVASGLDSGLHTFQWGGTNAGGAFVAAPVYYYFTISATDAKGRVVSYEPIGAQTNEIRIEVVANIPVISRVSDAPDPFFPPVQTNEMTYDISSPGNHTVTVTYEDSQRNVVSTFTYSGQGPGAHLVKWGGTNSAGANVPDGFYAYRVNIRRGANKGNEKTGAVILLRENKTNTVFCDVEIWHRTNEAFTIEEIPPAGLGGAAIGILADGLVAQSPIYNITNITGTGRTTNEPPFILIFQYDPAIEGDIEEKLPVRKYDAVNRRWRPLEPANQFIDYVNHQVIVEVWELSLLGLFTGKDTTPPRITILSPEPRTYTGKTGIAIRYEVEDPSGVMSETVYLNGTEYPYETIAPSDLLVGENWLTVKVFDKVGNMGWASVRFLVGLLEASVRLEPETLNVNPGVLTAFVRLPEGYDPGYITDATCDGAACESMQVNEAPSTGSGQAGTEMIIKFRRQAIEKALAEIGEEIDTSFIVRGTYMDETGTLVFEGTDEISKIMGE